MRARLAELTPAARRLARAAATLGAGTEARHAGALAGLSAAQSMVAADELRGAALMAPTRELEFLHPILRAAVHDDIPPSERAGAHGRAARLLAADAAPAELVAQQLIDAERLADPWVCEQLAVAARGSIVRGAAEAAVSYLRRALEEPPPAELRPRVLYELGSAEALANEGAAAAAHLWRAFDTAPAVGPRLEAARLYALVQYLNGQGEAGVRLLRSMLAATAGDDRLAATIEAQILGIGSIHEAQDRPVQAAVAQKVLRRDLAGQVGGGRSRGIVSRLGRLPSAA